MSTIHISQNILLGAGLFVKYEMQTDLSTSFIYTSECDIYLKFGDFLSPSPRHRVLLEALLPSSPNGVGWDQYRHSFKPEGIPHPPRVPLQFDRVAVLDGHSCVARRAKRSSPARSEEQASDERSI